jgi:hypothetical protein
MSTNRYQFSFGYVSRDAEKWPPSQDQHDSVYTLSFTTCFIEPLLPVRLVFLGELRGFARKSFSQVPASADGP